MVKKNSVVIRLDLEDRNRIRKFKDKNNLKGDPEAMRNIMKILDGVSSENKRKLKIRRDIEF